MDSNANTPIATLSYEWTEEYYAQFTDTLNKSLLGRTSIWFFIVWYVLIALILFLIGGAFNICIGVFLCFCAIYMVWNKYKGNSVSAIYKSYKIYQGLVTSYEFYDTHFVVSDKFGTNSYPYDLLYTIKSSKYGYVLCLSKVGGYFIPKGQCSQTLIQFINGIEHE